MGGGEERGEGSRRVGSGKVKRYKRWRRKGEKKGKIIVEVVEGKEETEKKERPTVLLTPYCRHFLPPL